MSIVFFYTLQKNAKMNHYLYKESPYTIPTIPKYSFIFCFEGLNSPVLIDFFSLIEE